MTAKKTAPAKAPAEKKTAPAVSKGEANGFRVGEVGVKVGGMVYAAGSVIPKELVTDEISPYLAWEANVEDTPADTDTPEGGEAPKTDGSEDTDLGAESNPNAPTGDAQAPQGADAQTGGNQ